MFLSPSKTEGELKLYELASQLVFHSFLQWLCPRPWLSATKASAEDLLGDLASTPLEQDLEDLLVQLQILEELGLMLGPWRTPFQASQERTIPFMLPYQRLPSPATVRWTEGTMVTQRQSARLSTSAPTTATLV